MKMNRYISLLLTVILLATASCQQDELVSGGTDETVTLTYSVGVDPDDAATRAIGAGQSIDQLLVGVFYEGSLVEMHTFENRTAEGKFPISVPLLRGKTYTLAFWAHDKDNTAYTVDESTMQVTVDYSKYNGKSLRATEAFEAFSAVKTGVTVSQNVVDGGNLSLTRPFAQVNVAAAEEDVLEKVKRAELTLTNLPTTFNPLTGAVSADNKTDYTFVFTDFSIEEGDKLTPSESTDSYTYLVSVWALPTAATDITVDLYDAEEGGNTVREQLYFAGIELKPNVRLNIVGNMIQQQTMAAWDGVTFDNPTTTDDDPEEKVEVECSVTWERLTNADQTRAAGNLLHIDTPAELAWILKNGLPDDYTGIHLCQNLNMGEHNWSGLEAGSVKPCNLPAGTLISALSANEGECFTVSNITMNGNGATGLFGDTQELTVKDITFSNIHLANDAATPVGILAGSVKGNLTMENVTVDGGSVSAQTAGGLVGKILRISEKDRTETLQADFNHCTVNATAINGTAMAGKFVGELSGYDNGEVLNFNGCSTSGVSGIATSDFCNDRKSCFIETSLTEDHFLGCETYCRGTVNFDGKRFVPKWDGVRSGIVPLVENSVNVIYSPYDVAYYQKKSPATVAFKADVDLGSHKFNPIYTIKTLDGENHTVYNLKVDMVHDGTGAAFIQTASGTTSHKNLIMRGADVKNVHNTSLYPAYAVTSDGGAGNAYGGIFMSRAHGTYTVENIHVKESKLYAACKMGGVIGSHTEGTLSMSNCSVDNCIIQNYKPNVPNYYVLGNDAEPWMTISLGILGTYYVNLLQWWYTNGEAGGLIGFLQSKEVNIDSCSVTNTAINCEGVDNKEVIANVYSSRSFKTSDPFNKNSIYYAQGKTVIAGRHVNQFIGDVVSYRAENGSDYVTNITNYTVSDNTYNGTSANSTNSNSHKYATNKYCEVVGCAYYIGLDITILNKTKHLKNYAGEIKFNSKDGASSGSFTEEEGDGNDIAWTGGDFSITTLQTTYPSEPTRIDPEY